MGGAPVTPLRGIALKVVSVALFVVMQAIVKAVSQTVPVMETAFFRSFFSIPVILIWLARTQGIRAGIRMRSPRAHLWRGVVGTTGMALSFTGLALLPLPEFVALTYTTPLLVVILAALFLGEVVRAFRIGCVVLGFAGVVVVLWPQLSVIGAAGWGDSHTLGVVVTMASTLTAAVAVITIRTLVATESTSAIVFWFFVVASVVMAMTLPFGWVVPTWREGALLVGAGVLGGVGQVMMTASYRHADASIIAPFDYVSMVFAILIALAVFNEAPTASTLAGSAIIITAGLLIIWREHRLGRERAVQRRAMGPPGS